MPEIKTVTMVATQRQNYGTRHVLSGEEFEMTEAEAKDAEAMQSAVRKPKKYLRRDMRPQE